MTDDAISEAEARMNDLAVRYLEKLTNAWLKQDLPFHVIANAMLSAGTAAIALRGGPQAAIDALDEVKFAIEEKLPPDATAH